jgi:hypothetical protein
MLRQLTPAERLQINSSARGTQLQTLKAKIVSPRAQDHVQQLLDDDPHSFAAGMFDSRSLENSAIQNWRLAPDAANEVYVWASQLQLPSEAQHAICFELGRGDKHADVANVHKLAIGQVDLVSLWLERSGLEPERSSGNWAFRLLLLVVLVLCLPALQHACRG